MGFLKAIYELGKMESESKDKDGRSCFSDIDNFLQLPMPVIKDEQRIGREIRIWLNVKDKDADCLDVTGIEKIDSKDYLNGNDSNEVEETKRMLLYRDPPGASTQWRYSPVYKLGKAVGNPTSALLGQNGIWRGNNDSRYYKLYKTVLKPLEDIGVFSKGSVELIMSELEEKADRIAELWKDKKRSYILVFGINDNGNFTYPGELRIFRDHFKSRLKQNIGGKMSATCSLCHAKAEFGANLDKIFKFSTFDKESFLPGIKDGDGVREKVFPLCDSCISMMSMGREILDGRFLDKRIIPNMNIYVVPELIFGNTNLGDVAVNVENFIKSGLKKSERLFNYLAKQDETLVYHFLFWEENQAQEQLHLMVEDVPPSRLKRLEKFWQDIYKVLLWNEIQNPEFKPEYMGVDLDQAFKIIYSALISLSGKDEADKIIMRKRIVDIIGKLLGGNKVDVKFVKQLMVSRFAGLFADPQWIRYGHRELRKMMAVLEFLNRANDGR